MRSCSRAAAVLILIVGHTTLEAQSGLVITGVVQDQTGAAFFGADVVLLKDGEQQRSTTTDTSGAFRFDRLQPGNYEVRIQREGFKTDTRKLVLGTRPPAPLRIVLSIETLNQQITVSGHTRGQYRSKRKS